MPERKTKTKAEPGIGQTIKDDLNRDDFLETLKRDWDEIREFYITDGRKERLKTMGTVKSWLFTVGWVLKGLFLRLNPTRRLLLILGFILILISGKVVVDGEQVSGNNIEIVGCLIVVFVIMLELKDKLLAEGELQEGRSVQIALMPETAPEIPGWELWLYSRPANDVGGDIVDYISIDEARHGIAIGDISGKGLGAALLMAKLQATIRALAPDYTSLSELGAKINNIFYRDTVAKSFASMAYLEINSESNTLRLVNAGHIPPLIVTPNEIKDIDKVAPALGIIKGARYVEQNIVLNSDDCLLIYSDGLTDARNEFGTFFGETRLRKHLDNIKGLTAILLGEQLLKAVDDFVGTAPAHDDLSMVVLRKL